MCALDLWFCAAFMNVLRTPRSSSNGSTRTATAAFFIFRMPRNLQNVLSSLPWHAHSKTFQSQYRIVYNTKQFLWPVCSQNKDSGWDKKWHQHYVNIARSHKVAFFRTAQIWREWRFSLNKNFLKLNELVSFSFCNVKEQFSKNLFFPESTKLSKAVNFSGPSIYKVKCRRFC